MAIPALCVGGNLLAVEPSTADLEKELAALLELPSWSLTATLSAAVGHKDNILLSSSNPVGSGFFRGEAEATLLRLPTAGLDGYVFLNVIETRFFSAQQTDHERTAFLVGEVRWEPSDSLKWSFQGQGYHQDQVFDVSTTEISLDTSVLKITGFSLAPGVRWKFSSHWWLDGKAIARKDSYDRDLDGYDDGEARIRVGQSWGHGSDWSFGGGRRWRAHDSREQFSTGGRPLAGTILKARLTDVGMQINWILDAAKRWKINGTVLREQNRDNGTGYFDYDRDLVMASVTWARDPWEVQLGFSRSDYEFPVQLVGFGISPDYRRKKETRVTLDLKRRLSETWQLFGRFETERSTSNDDRSRFRVNSGYVGISWSWDQLSKSLDD